MNPPAAPAPAQPAVDPAQTHLTQEFKHASPLFGCRFDATGEFVFAGAGKKTALVGHNSWLRGLACTKEKLLFSGGYDGKILTWLAAFDHPTPANTFDAHTGWVRALAVSPDGKLLASCGNDNLVKIWSTSDGKLVRELPGHDSHVYNLAFHPAGEFLASADLKGTIKVWDVAKGTWQRDLDVKVLHKYDESFRADHGGARGMAFNADGTLLACAGITEVSNAFAGVGKPLIVQLDWQTGKQKLLQKPRENFQGTRGRRRGRQRRSPLVLEAGPGARLLRPQTADQRARPRPAPGRPAPGDRVCRRHRPPLRPGAQGLIFAGRNAFANSRYRIGILVGSQFVGQTFLSDQSDRNV